MKAMHAAMCSDPGTFNFKITAPKDKGYYQISQYTRYTCSNGGYVTHRVKVALDHYHYLMVSKRKDLLVNIDEGSVWRHLRSDRFTTPLLREWTPYILHKLQEDYRWRYNGLQKLTGWGQHAGLFNLTTQALDEIVSEGLRIRELLIERKSDASH